jgi:ATP-dependent DNA helicase DinG
VEYIVVDLETTGLNADDCDIIEIGAVKIKDNEITDTFQTFVNIDYELPFEVKNLTGINDSDLKQAPDIIEAMKNFQSFIGECVNFIAHNAEFEKSFLDDKLNFRAQWLDTIDIAHIVKPTVKYVRLAALLPLYNLINEHAHRAIDDAIATAKLFLAMVKEFDSFDRDLLMKFLQLASNVHSPLAELIKIRCTEVLSKFPAKTIHSFDTDNDYLNFAGNILMNNPEANNQKINWNWEIPQKNINDFFEDLIAANKQKNNFESRPQQLEMAQKVADAMSNHYALLVEAGTGTGKSLAYLLPAILYAKGSGMPVFISTNTINLQEQLINKDIPLLKKYLTEDFSSVVVKGRNNYICNRKWHIAIKNCTEETLALYLRIAHWQTITLTGDFSEMNLYGKDSEDAQHLASAAETCTSYRCPFYQHQCFINNIRNQAKKANIIIINHSLLLSVSMLGEGSNNILPPINNLIIDEAHQLENVAEKQFSYYISEKLLNKIFTNLWQQEKFHNIIKALKQIQSTENTIKLLENINQNVLECKNYASDFFKISEDLFVNKTKIYEKQLRIVNQRYDEDCWQPIETALSNLIISIECLCKSLKEIINEFDNIDDPFFSIDLMGIFKITLANLSEYQTTAQSIIDNKLVNEEECVIWLEKSNSYEKPSWKVCPEDIRNSLNQYVYTDKLSIIMTSATLSGTSFDFFINQIGLNQSDMEIQTLSLSSPFNYKQNCKILLAADLPDYTKTNENIIVKALSDYLYEIIKAAKGRSLVLFTSYAQEKAVYKLLSPLLTKEGIKVLAHGISGGRNHILESQKQNSKSCILGVNSFWEGVDIQGEALSLLVIIRLPFNPPNNPILEAKFERLQKEGKNPFTDYSLPQAIIRFKQGFGRLIRSKNDKGIVCIMDTRIWSKSYGKKFLSALPDTEVCRLTKQEIVDQILKFLN